MGGHGLWIVNQVCDQVEMRSDETGTTIRLHMDLPQVRPRFLTHVRLHFPAWCRPARRSPPGTGLPAVFGQVRTIPRESAVWYNKCVDLLTVSVTARESAGEPYTLVEIAGEADVTNTDELRRLLDDEVSQQPRTLIIDLSGLRFMDSSALHALLRVNRH